MWDIKHNYNGANGQHEEHEEGFVNNHQINQINQIIHCASHQVHLVSSGDKKYS